MTGPEAKGIKKAVQQQIDNLKNISLEPGEFISQPLIQALADITATTQREVCVYITRNGKII